MAGKITYKIDRLSNSALELGLKTGAVLTGSASNITSAKPLAYTSDLTLGSGDTKVLTPKKYVDDAITSSQTTIKGLMRGLVTNSDGLITITNNWGSDTSVNPIYTLGLAALTVDSAALTANHTYQDNDASKVVSGVQIDKYGRTIGLVYKQISVSNLDLSSNTSLDNYVQWNLKIGSATTSASNTIAIGSGNSKQTTAGKTTEAITGSSTVQLQFLAGNGIDITNSGSVVTFAAKLLSNGPIIHDASGNLTLQDLSGSNETADTAAFVKLKWDKYGRVTGNTAVAASDIRGLSGINHTSSQNGLVNYKTTSNTEDAATSKYFYTENGKWATIPYNKVDVAAIGASDERPILAASSASDTSITTVKNASITVSGAGVLKATTFSGSGANLTNLPADKLTGDIAIARLNSIKSSIIDWTIPSDLTANTVVLASNGTQITSLLNPTGEVSANYVLTSTIQAGGTGNTAHWESIATLVGNIAQSAIQNASGFIFKGILGSGSGQTALPTTGFKSGWFYRVGEAGTYAGIACEVGDALYCTKDYDTLYKADTYSQYWSALEQNLNDAITYNSGAATSGVLAIKTAGSKIVQDAMAASYANNAWTITGNVTGTASKWATARTIAGLSIDGSQDVNSNLAVSNIKTVDASTGTGSRIGSDSTSFADAYITNVHATNVTATTFTGDLTGNAATATKVKNAFTVKGYGSSDIVYDGSAAKEINLSASSLGYMKSFASITAIGSEQNVISGIAASKAADGTVTITPTYAKVVSDVTSDIFNIGTDGFKKTISFIGGKNAGKFYTGTADPTNTNRLNYDGYFHAAKVYSGTKEVATKITAATDKILTCDSTGGYQSSDKSFTTTITASDTAVPTASAVKSYADTLVSDAVKVKTATFSKTTGATVAIPACFVEHIDVVVTEAYATDPAFQLTITGGDIIGGTSTNDIDLTTAGDIFEYKVCQSVSAGNIVISGLGSTATAGAGTVYVYYK